MSGSIKQPKDGFYYLHHSSEKEPILVRGYKSRNNNEVFGFGFNVHDGGGFLPLSDMTGEETIFPVIIESPVASYEITDNDAMVILELLLNKFEIMKQGKEESREQFMNREDNNRSLIGIISDIVTMSTKRKEGETAILKVVFRG